MYKVENFKSDKNKQYYFRIVASNGQIVAQSEGYKNKKDRDTIALKMLGVNVDLEKIVNIQDGDLLIFTSKLGSDFTDEAIETAKYIKDVIFKASKKNVFCLFLNNTSIAKIPESTMAELGWYRFPKYKVSVTKNDGEIDYIANNDQTIKYYTSLEKAKVDARMVGRSSKILDTKIEEVKPDSMDFNLAELLEIGDDK